MILKWEEKEGESVISKPEKSSTAFNSHLAYPGKLSLTPIYWASPEHPEGFNTNKAITGSRFLPGQRHATSNIPRRISCRYFICFFNKLSQVFWPGPTFISAFSLEGILWKGPGLTMLIKVISLPRNSSWWTPSRSTSWLHLNALHLPKSKSD